MYINYHGQPILHIYMYDFKERKKVFGNDLLVVAFRYQALHCHIYFVSFKK